MAMNKYLNAVDTEGKLSSSSAPSSDNDLVNKTYVDQSIAVTVSSGKFLLDGSSQASAALKKSGRFIFDLSGASADHPFKLSETADGTHGGGSEYTTGVTTVGSQGSAGARLVLELTQASPSTIYYYCSSHSGMGGNIFTGSVGGAITQSADGKVGIGVASPGRSLDVSGDIKIRGGDILGSGASAAIQIDGSANITVPQNLTVSGTFNGLNYPTSDGSSNQVLTTNGSGTLSFTTVSGGGGSGISSVSADSDPTLGGNLKVAGYSIVSTSNGNIAITPDGSGKIVLDGLSWPIADGSNGQYLSTDGSGALSWATASGGGGSSESSDSYTLGYSTLNGSTSGSVSSALTIPSGKTLTIITIDVGTGFVTSYGSGTYASIYFKIGDIVLQPEGAYSSYGSVSRGTTFWGYADTHGSVSSRITTSSSTDISLHWANQSNTLTAGSATIKAWYR
tara:strand:- start:6735 stop:8087 length:1353 start_codon:yes stop_codon:yes gene_type:complete